MMADEKTRETRLRRMAERQGLELRKSRRRDPLAKDYGRYWVVDAEVGRPADRFPWEGADLDGVEEFLTTPPADRSMTPVDVDAMRRWLQENLPSDEGVVRVDGKAIEAWIKRNPNATAEDIVQIVQAPDHFIELITREREDKGAN
jgi:hypothetical protein